MTGEVQWKICSLQQLFISASVWLLAMEVFLCWFLMFRGWYGKQNFTHLLMMTLACIGKRSLNWCILPCNTFLCSGLDWRKQLEPEFKLKGFLLASHEKRSNMHFKKALNLSKDSGYLKKKQQTLGMCASFSWDCTLEQALEVLPRFGEMLLSLRAVKELLRGGRPSRACLSLLCLFFSRGADLPVVTQQTGLYTVIFLLLNMSHLPGKTWGSWVWR